MPSSCRQERDYKSSIVTRGSYRDHVNLSSWGKRALQVSSVCSWSVPIPKEKKPNYRRKDREKLFAQCFCMACQIGEIGESETWRVTTGLCFNVSDIETNKPPWSLWIRRHCTLSSASATSMRYTIEPRSTAHDNRQPIYSPAASAYITI
ncbi:hypothetical protein BKA70DRAFT_1556197 [Coprinopsis sp. MPI-PUGE-AT-0042]|nr:hypothetical protein BKA70DRAFT_1556197 [Coprinopsis sp. MPI-PUGE-AT-0042]